MSTAFAREIARNGPESCESISVEEARQRSVQLARSHSENFSVLSRFVPRDLRADFAAIYAFCRWADDLGDEVGDRQRALELLAWWRDELRGCFAGAPRHPVFVALLPTIQRHDLPIEPFADLISAFEQDQTVPRYETWAQVLDYCRRSADPVGRLVLMVCGERREDPVFARSDAICTALQLTNHWQDVARDILERDRIYIPRELNPIEGFEERLRQSARQGYACDHAFLEESRRVIRACVERTWPLYEEGEKLLDMVSRRSQPIIWLFLQGGQSVLRRVEQWNYETALHRPRLSRLAKGVLIARAWLKYGRSARGVAGTGASP